MYILLNTYKGGILLSIFGLVLGFIGVTFFNSIISSSDIAIFIFVSVIVVMGLSGAIVVARTFYRRHDPFKKTR
jgi:O-antigen/teichoic acid export membrane protein